MTHTEERKTWTVEDIRAFFRSLRKVSPFLRAVAGQREKDLRTENTGSGRLGSRTLGSGILRQLTEEEIASLTRQGNYSSSWEKVRVCPDFTPGPVRGSRFEGQCVLGSFSEGGLWARADHTLSGNLPPGIWNSLIIDSEIGNNCALYNVVPLKGVVLMEDCTIADSSVTGEETEFGNDTILSLGVEAGGRDLPVFAEVVPSLLSSLLHCPSEDPRRIVYREEWEQYRREIAYHRSFIMSGASIKGAKEIRNVFLGPAVDISGAALVSNSTICSQAQEPTVLGPGVQVRDSIIQEGCEVITQGLVEKALLFEHSHVERQGKVTQSVLSPNTGVGEGEVSSSYLGPFIGFHHQSMLIAAVWPEGKGNVGAGANIGSNHTSRAPDQELFPGEGMFFGIGCCIKYPGDYRKAPYTIVVTGTTTLPQKVDFPFSLITPPSKYYEISPVFNRLIPGWSIYNNMYYLVRNEEKYEKRNRSRRTRFPVEIFREEIVRYVLNGLDRLASVPERKVLYRIEDIPGLGKNFMLEEDRKAGIGAYDFVIDFFSVREAKRLLIASGETVPPWLPSRPEERWGTLKDPTSRGLTPQEMPLFVGLLNTRGWCDRGLEAVLRHYMECLDVILEKTLYSKKKDDFRGERIQPDYFLVHQKAEEDPLIKRLKEKVSREKRETELLLNRSTA